MKIVEFFTSNNKEHWLSEIEKCDWGAGQYLHQLLKEKNLKNMVGEAAIVPMLVDGNMSIFLPGIPVCMRNTAMNSTGWIRGYRGRGFPCVPESSGGGRSGQGSSLREWSQCLQGTGNVYPKIRKREILSGP